MILHAARHANIHFYFILFLVLHSWDKSRHSLPQPFMSFCFI
jgi:hypothetical protein